MATEITANDAVQPLALELHPQVDHLVTEDDTPVDNIFSEKQQRLLVDPLHSSWPGPGKGRRFVAMSNVGLFYAIRQPPYVPDMLLSLDVQLPVDLWPKSHRSYFTWEYGKPPDAAVEVVSDREGGEDTDKLTGYARIAIDYYAIFDPEYHLGPDLLRVFELQGNSYRQMSEPYFMSGIALGLQLWHGTYEDHENTWLRWVDAAGILIPTANERHVQQRQRADREQERADHEQQRADHEQQRADREQERADRLAEQLRQLGAEPETE